MLGSFCSLGREQKIYRLRMSVSQGGSKTHFFRRDAKYCNFVIKSENTAFLQHEQFNLCGCTILIINEEETWKRGKRESGWFWYRTGKVNKSINDTIINLNTLLIILSFPRTPNHTDSPFPCFPFSGDFGRIKNNKKAGVFTESGFFALNLR